MLFVYMLVHTLTCSSLYGPIDIVNNFGQRTVQDIVISCLVTIFACTWTTIHPSIPAPTDCWWTRFKRQVTIMVCALLAPEVMTIWALEQYFAAKEIMKEYNREILEGKARSSNVLDSLLNLDASASDVPQQQSARMSATGKLIPASVNNRSDNMPRFDKPVKGARWTMAHAFFAQMGGFMLSEQGKPLCTMLASSRQRSRTLLYHIQEGIVDVPRITEEDIMDRSNSGGAIAKIFIIFQTTSFIVQCITQWSQCLPVTELEIVTITFVTLNGITYILRWHKPQNVGRPVFLELKKRNVTPLNIIDMTKEFRLTNDTSSADASTSDCTVNFRRDF